MYECTQIKVFALYVKVTINFHIERPFTYRFPKKQTVFRNISLKYSTTYKFITLQWSTKTITPLYKMPSRKIITIDGKLIK